MSNQTIHELTNLSEISTNDELPIWDNSAGATKKVSVEELSLAVNNTVNSYSTEEVNTGTKWIDGKAVYKKTFDLGTLPNNGQESKTNVLSGIDKIVRIEGMAINSAGSCMSLPYADYYSSSIHVIAVTVYAKKDIEVRSNYNATEFSGYATIYYTKAS